MKNDVAIVAWDFSKYSKAALSFAIENYEPANIKVLCVLERPNLYLTGVNWDPDAEKNAHEVCAKDFFDEAVSAKKLNLKFFTKFGDPASMIVQFAKDQNATSIVMSTHGRTGVSRLVVGSVMQKVLSHAECPVVVLPKQYVNTQHDSSD